MKQNLVCYHCASTILPGELVETQLAGVNRSFCCPGCMAIAQTIHGEGLEVFYSRRAQACERPAAYLSILSIFTKGIVSFFTSCIIINLSFALVSATYNILGQYSVDKFFP